MRPGYTTILYRSMNTFRTLSYVWGALRRYFPEEALSSIRGITMTKDEKGAVFDVEDQYLHYFTEFMQVRLGLGFHPEEYQPVLHLHGAP